MEAINRARATASPTTITDKINSIIQFLYFYVCVNITLRPQDTYYREDRRYRARRSLAQIDRPGNRL